MKKKLIALLLAVVLVCTLAACDGTSGREITGEEIVIHLNNTVQVLDPLSTSAVADLFVIYQIFDSLLEPTDEDYYNLRGSLAETWSVTPDGLTYTFNLRQGVLFHNGDEMTSEDVKFSIDRCATSALGAAAYSAYAGTEIVDKYTVKIYLKYADASFPSVLASYNSSIVNKKIMETYKVGDREAICGTGAYKLSSWEEGGDIVLEATESYHFGVPSIKRVIFRQIVDLNAATIAFENGEIDMFNFPQVADLAELRVNEKWTAVDITKPMVNYIAMQNQHGPTADINVRKAIAHALDRTMLSAVYGGYYDTDVTLISDPTMEGWTTDVEKYAFNVELAKQYMATAGYNTTDKRLALTIVVPVADTMEALCTVLQSNLREIGIDLTVNSMEGAAWHEKVVSREYELAFMQMSYLPWLSTLMNFMMYRSDGYYNVSDLPSNTLTVALPDGTAATIDDILNWAFGTYDYNTRNWFYQEVNKIVNQQCAYVPMTYDKQTSLYDARLENVHFDVSNLISKVYRIDWVLGD